MNQMSFLTILLISLIFFLSFIQPVLAVCPLCTLAVGAGLGLSRYLGIDDAISGLWVGGIILSSSFWLISYLKSKKINFKFFGILIISLMYLLILLPLWQQGIIGHPLNQLFGIDKLLFGTLVGSLTFFIGILSDKEVRKIEGYQLFSYQKVVFPVSALLIMSVIMYLIPK